MLMMREGFNPWMMRGIVVAQDHTAARILPVVPVAEPGERPFLSHKRFADLHKELSAKRSLIRRFARVAVRISSRYRSIRTPVKALTAARICSR